MLYLTTTLIDSLISSSNHEITLTANVPNGWVYIRADDPGQEQYILKQVIRSDGREIRVDENAWTTHRTIRLIDQPTIRQHLLHLLDYTDGGTYSYTLIYEDITATPEPPELMFIPDRSMPKACISVLLLKQAIPTVPPALSVSGLPPGAAFTDKGNGEGTFDWATSAGDTGQYEMTFTASGGELTATRTTIVTIYSDKDDDIYGMPDEWEMEYFNSLERDGTGDYDEDGISDLNEYLNNSDPKNISGDIYHDKEIDLKDAVIALQIYSGITPDSIVEKGADVNKDRKIGTEEIIFILQNIGTSI